MKDFLNIGFIILALMSQLVTPQLPEVTNGAESTEASLSTGAQTVSSAEPISEDNNSSNSPADPSESISQTESSTEGPATLITLPRQGDQFPSVPSEARTGNGANESSIDSSTSSPPTTSVTTASTTTSAITTAKATTTTTTTSTVSPSQPTTSITVTTAESASSVSSETLPASTESSTVTNRTDNLKDITTYLTTEITAGTVNPVSNENSTSFPTSTFRQPEVTETTTQSSSHIKSSISAQPQPDPMTTLSSVESTTEAVTRPSDVSENTPDQKSSEAEPASENRTLSTQSPGEPPEIVNSTTAERIAETTQSPKTTAPSESSEAPITKTSKSGCFSTSEINTILVVAVIVGVNILSVVVTAYCVHRLVSRKLSWDPPPMQYSKRRSAGNHPVPAPRGTTAGRHLATDVECRAGETPATHIPIVITNEDGWCVPYSDQDKKKKNSVDNNTEDTGV